VAAIDDRSWLTIERREGAGVINTLETTIRPRSTPPAVKVGAWFFFAASAVGGVMYLRGLKSNDDEITRQQPSIERVRTDVQRTVDDHALIIERNPIATTLSHVKALERPRELVRDRMKFASTRIAPFETQVWTITANVTQAVVRADKDMYLIIEAEGLWGCVEVPAPEHCKGSVFEKEISAVRSQLNAEIHPTLTPKKVNRKAQLTGVGFFGTAGKRENGARLLPLLQIKWLE
jgi:hypothetical protein